MNDSAVSRERLQGLVDDHAFIAGYQFRVREVARGSCCIEIPFQAHYVRPGGVIPGFIYMAAADVGAWLAVYTMLGESADLSVTTEMRTSFLSGVAGEAFTCEARVLDVGSQLIFVEATCRSLAGAIATHHTLSYIVPPSR